MSGFKKDDPSKKGTFQSEAAAEAAIRVEERTLEEPKSAAVTGVGDEEGEGVVLKAMDLSGEYKLVEVKPRVSIPRTRIGGVWYSLIEGKRALVPNHVRRLLEEKGIL
jgi:hypothetical protein